MPLLYSAVYGQAKTFLFLFFSCHAISCAHTTAAHVERDEATASATPPLMLAGKHGACTRGRQADTKLLRQTPAPSINEARKDSGRASEPLLVAIPPARFCADLVFQLAQPIASVGMIAYRCFDYSWSSRRHQHEGRYPTKYLPRCRIHSFSTVSLQHLNGLC